MCRDFIGGRRRNMLSICMKLLDISRQYPPVCLGGHLVYLMSMLSICVDLIRGRTDILHIYRDLVGGRHECVQHI